MTREECGLFIRKVFEDFYRGVTLYDDYVLTDNAANRGYVEGMVKYIEKTYGLQRIDVHWIINYMEFSFEWWYKNDFWRQSRGRGFSIQLHWIIGKKAIQRHESFKGKTWRASVMRDKLRRDVGLSIRNKYGRVNLDAVEANRQWLVVGTDGEEEFKKQFHNLPEGLLWCRANTTLYNHKSPSCASCSSRRICYTLLQKEYPKLYELRGYNDGAALR